MENKEKKYLKRKKIKAAGKTIELEFTTITRFGTHDCTTWGESIVEIVNNKSEGYEIKGGITNNWEEIFPGVFIMRKAIDSESILTEYMYVKVEPEACPVEIIVHSFHKYWASDYPHCRDDNKDEFYILVINNTQAFGWSSLKNALTSFVNRLQSLGQKLKNHLWLTRIC